MTLHKNYGNKKVVAFQNAVNVFLLLLFAIATLFPIYFMITSSFGDPIEAGAVNYALIPQKITLASYEFFFNFSPHSYKWIFNSLVVSSALTVSNVLFAGLAGYDFAKVRFFGRRNLFFIFLCSLMIPYQVVQVPLYILVVNVFQVANTYLALIMPGFCSVYNIFLAKQFMSTLPSEIIECAKIEGCNQLQIYFRIIFPLSKTVLAVMAIMTFMNNWNSFFWPFLVTNTMDMQTIQVGLKNFRFANTTYFSPMMAGATVSALPMFILFFSLQKYFLEGVTVGAVKG
jgi:multiple sugar transport system permease protein